MREAFQSDAVAVVLSEQQPPRLLGLSEVPQHGIALDGVRFEDSGLGDWLGFYDWLRTSGGDILGVRLWIDEDSPKIDALGNCMDVHITVDKSHALVFFGAEREFDPAASNDQDFGGNRLFVGQSGYVLTFNSPAL
jgi:hypothetical protein